MMRSFTWGSDEPMAALVTANEATGVLEDYGNRINPCPDYDHHTNLFRAIARAL